METLVNMDLGFESYRYLTLPILKKAIPAISSGRRKQYIDYLLKNDQNKLRLLIELCKTRKKTSFFLFNLHDSFRKIGSFDSLSGHKWEIDDFIYKITKIVRDEEDVVIKVMGYTSRRNIKWCEPSTLKKQSVVGRRNFSISIIVHFMDKILEVRTSSAERANEIAQLYADYIVPKSKTLLIKSLKTRFEDRHSDAKPESATFNFGGSDVLLKGDPKQTIDAMKDQGFDLGELPRAKARGVLG